MGSHCCWPGQDWGARSQRCVGTPRCPAEMVPKDNTCVAGPADSPEKIKAKLASVGQQVTAKCRRRLNGWAIAQLTIDRYGVPRNVKVVGSFSDTPTGACIEALLRDARFAARRKPISIKYPFHIKAR